MSIIHKGRVYESAYDMPDDVLEDFVDCVGTILASIGYVYSLKKLRS